MNLGRNTRHLFIAVAMFSSPGCDLVGVTEHDSPHIEGPSQLRLSSDRVTLYLAADGGNEDHFPSSRSLSARVLDAADNALEEKAGEVQWLSSDEAIAVVNASGLVRTVATGSVTLTASSVLKPSVRATASVTVLDAGHANVVVR